MPDSRPLQGDMPEGFKGYVIINEDGDSLARGLYWQERTDSYADAYIHTDDALTGIDTSDWEIKPAHALAATYTDGKAIIDGEEIDFSKLIETLRK